MSREAAVDAIVGELERAPSVEGAFLSGSLVDRHLDDFSDVDLGVASRDDAEAFGEAYDLRHRLLTAAGRPVHRLERGWSHCRMVAALYGKAEYPPIGLEIDIVFSRLRHVGEQTPHAERVFGAKRAHRYLSQAERAVLEASYLRSDEDAVERLARLYLGIVNELAPAYGIAGQVAAPQGVLRELVDV